MKILFDNEKGEINFIDFPLFLYSRKSFFKLLNLIVNDFEIKFERFNYLDERWFEETFRDNLLLEKFWNQDTSYFGRNANFLGTIDFKLKSTTQISEEEVKEFVNYFFDLLISYEAIDFLEQEKYFNSRA
ncbi:MAG: hypothetical protein QW524_01765 [Candidatus Woesearchaeota archaeon]